MPPPVIIENPILNSPFEEPRKHFKFSDDGITDNIVEERRRSSYFVPIAQPKKKGKPSLFENEWTADRAKDNDDINYIRSRVAPWRKLGYPSATPVSHSLLAYWQRPDRERRLFFCQIEALETLIFLTEAADKSGDVGILNKLNDARTAAGTSLTGGQISSRRSMRYRSWPSRSREARHAIEPSGGYSFRKER
jgi:type III restriction enzyme